MLKLGKSIIVHKKWRAEHGRTNDLEKDPPVCLTCPGRPIYSSECAALDHEREQVRHQTVTEAAPEEDKHVIQLYGAIHRRLAKLGYAPGDAVYFLPHGIDIDALIAGINAEVAEANASFNVCHIKLDWEIFDLAPDTSHEATLTSLRHTIETATTQLLDALKAADLKALREALRTTQNVSKLLDGESKDQIDELASYTARAADWIKTATKAGEDAVAKVTAEIQDGAARFSSIVADLFAEPPTKAVEATQTTSAA